MWLLKSSGRPVVSTDGGEEKSFEKGHEVCYICKGSGS